MAIIGALLQEVVKRKGTNLEKKKTNFETQKLTLKKLLEKARNTAFGKEYRFNHMLRSDNFIDEFRQIVPVFDYESFYNHWWHRLLDGESNICWPGKTKYFALTSGTSNASSKKVPISNDMIQSIRKVGVRQLFATVDFNVPADFYQKGILMLGGSTNLMKVEDYFEGDLSGIMANKLPFWLNRFYKPGKPIAKVKDWNEKLDHIARSAHKWDIGAVCGVPAWVQLMMEKVIRQQGVANIHEIWPNLLFYVHGGVCFEPYKKTFEQLLGRTIYYLETYLASEGFLAYQRGKTQDMELVLDNGIFFEFVPFNDRNFSPDGHIIRNPQTCMLDEVKEGVDYAILISTNAGTWRYLIGDTIRFTSVENYEIRITGRTKHFLSLCGEHLSVDNMNNAIHSISDELKLNIREFTVAGIPYENLFAHKWFIGVDHVYAINKHIIKEKLDATLKRLNDDYNTERKAALKEIFVEVLPNQVFYDYMRSKGKEGGQHKFPRVINGQLEEWEAFIKS
jgi:hypothetical protein